MTTAYTVLAQHCSENHSNVIHKSNLMNSFSFKMLPLWPFCKLQIKKLIVTSALSMCQCHIPKPVACYWQVAERSQR